MIKTLVPAFAMSLALSACFTTQIKAGQSRSVGPTHEDQQWFTLGGLVQLSDAAGQECPNGVSWSESGYSGTDVLIGIGLLLAGTLAGSVICDRPENPTDEELNAYTLCTSGTGGLVPFLIGSRSVEYQCVGGNSAPGIQVQALSLVPGQRGTTEQREKVEFDEPKSVSIP